MANPGIEIHSLELQRGSDDRLSVEADLSYTDGFLQITVLKDSSYSHLVHVSVDDKGMVVVTVGRRGEKDNQTIVLFDSTANLPCNSKRSRHA